MMKQLLLTILVMMVGSGTVQNNNQYQKIDISQTLREIPSPYLFASKEMNLQAIGSNLNPSLANQQQINKKVGGNIADSTNLPIQKLQAQQNSSLKNNKQIDLSIMNNSQNTTQNQTKEPIPIKGQEPRVYKAQFQKIDLKKLMQQIEKQEKNKKIKVKNQSQKTYETLFGSINNLQLHNSSNSLLQATINNRSNTLNQPNKQTKNKIKNFSDDKGQAQKDKKQLDFQLNNPINSQILPKQTLNDKDLQLDQQKLKLRQDDKIVELKDRYESQLIEKQAYKQKYDKILKQMQRLKDRQRVYKSQSQKIQKNQDLQNTNDQKEKTFCLSLTIVLLLTFIILLIGLYCCSKKGQNTRIKDRYSLDDDQKIPSDQMD